MMFLFKKPIIYCIFGVRIWHLSGMITFYLRQWDQVHTFRTMLKPKFSYTAVCRIWAKHSKHYFVRYNCKVALFMWLNISYTSKYLILEDYCLHELKINAYALQTFLGKTFAPNNNKAILQCQRWRRRKLAT